MECLPRVLVWIWEFFFVQAPEGSMDTMVHTVLVNVLSVVEKKPRGIPVSKQSENRSGWLRGAVKFPCFLVFTEAASLAPASGGCGLGSNNDIGAT